MSDLDKKLDIILLHVSDSVTELLEDRFGGKSFEKEIEPVLEAKQDIKQLIIEARIDELKKSILFRDKIGQVSANKLIERLAQLKKGKE